RGHRANQPPRYDARKVDALRTDSARYEGAERSTAGDVYRVLGHQDAKEVHPRMTARQQAWIDAAERSDEPAAGFFRLLALTHDRNRHKPTAARASRTSRRARGRTRQRYRQAEPGRLHKAARLRASRRAVRRRLENLHGQKPATVGVRALLARGWNGSGCSAW